MVQGSDFFFEVIGGIIYSQIRRYYMLYKIVYFVSLFIRNYLLPNSYINLIDYGIIIKVIYNLTNIEN